MEKTSLLHNFNYLKLALCSQMNEIFSNFNEKTRARTVSHFVVEIGRKKITIKMEYLRRLGGSALAGSHKFTFGKSHLNVISIFQSNKIEVFSLQYCHKTLYLHDCLISNSRSRRSVKACLICVTTNPQLNAIAFHYNLIAGHKGRSCMQCTMPVCNDRWREVNKQSNGEIGIVDRFLLHSFVIPFVLECVLICLFVFFFFGVKRVNVLIRLIASLY